MPLDCRFVLTLAAAFAAGAQAAPSNYLFVTAPSAFGGPALPGGPAPDPAWFAGGAAGSFAYDPAALAAQTNADGSVSYRGYAPASQTGFATAFNDLAGQVAGLSFSDPNGAAQVGDDTATPSPPGGPKTDLFQLFADPDLTSTQTHNLNGFSINGFTLYRVRMFWIEGQQTPETIPDFLSGSALLAAPPAFHGRLALDFYETANPSARSFIFFDGLSVSAVPEPASWLLMAAGLGLLARRVSRRRA
jgi:hypothetical protein